MPINMYVCSIVCPTPHYRFFLLIFMSSGISTNIRPPSSLQTSDIRKRRVSYTFTASPTSGVTYNVTFTHQREGIPQPKNNTFDSVSTLWYWVWHHMHPIVVSTILHFMQGWRSLSGCSCFGRTNISGSNNTFLAKI